MRNLGKRLKNTKSSASFEGHSGTQNKRTHTHGGFQVRGSIVREPKKRSAENGWHSVNFCKGYRSGPNCSIIVSSSGRMTVAARRVRDDFLVPRCEGSPWLGADASHALLVQPLIIAICAMVTTSASAGTDDGIAFFESRIRPVLVESCYKCHSSQSKRRPKAACAWTVARLCCAGARAGRRSCQASPTIVCSSRQ